MKSSHYSLYDFFVEIIPGALALLLIISLVPAGHSIFDRVFQAGLFEGTSNPDNWEVSITGTDYSKQKANSRRYQSLL